MKKTLLLLLLILSISTGFAQRKKNVKNPKTAMSSINVLASSGAMTVELSKNIFFVTLDTKKPVKDTIQLKKYTDKSAPMGCKLQSFTSKGQALYLVTWTDTYQKTSPLSKENITETNTVIFEIDKKTKLLSNSQKSTAISEIHYLDAKKTVSETIEKKRNEGYAFTLLPNGDINLKTKSQNETKTYDKAKNQFVSVKK